MVGSGVDLGMLVLAALAALLGFVLLLALVRRRRTVRELADRTERVAGLEEALAREGSAKAALERRFAVVLDIESEAEAAKAKADAERARADEEAADLERKIVALRADYAAKRKVYDGLVNQVAVFDERLAFAELGLYEPHFEFDDSDAYKAAIERVRAQQKGMVAAKSAVICETTWTVDGSASKGKTMTDRAIRLTLRAFNNECEAAIATVRWNNAKAMEKRLETALSQIDAMNASNRVVITPAFFRLKLDELRLTHEYREKQKAEKEERAEMARAAREEAKLRRDLERAEEEESRYARMLARARKEAEGAAGSKLEAYSAQIEILERELAEARARTERAQALAERTRTGWVYVISNVGSFGPDAVKIGLTRRLDPTERIRELGDASVPFVFDVHAVIYSDDAPALERALHAEFADGRVNAKNLRKEFFRASIAEVEKAVHRLAPEASFFSDVEAQEYRETLAMRDAALRDQTSRAPVLPEAI